MRHLTVVTLGPGNPAYLTRQAEKALREAKHLILRTARHRAVDWLRRRGVEHLKVVYSRETPIEPLFQPETEPAPAEGPEAYGNKRRSIPGSSAFVPSAAGLIMASAMVRELLQAEN